MSLPFIRNAILAAAAVALACPTFSAEPGTPSTAELLQQIQTLQERLQTVQGRLDQLEQKESGNWLDSARTNQIRAIVADVLADAKKQGQSADGATFGYSGGFFIQNADKTFRLNVNGFIQARYTYALDQVRREKAFATVPKSGDVNGFDFRRARLIFSGNALNSDLTYYASMDFAGDAADKNPLASVTTNGAGDVTATAQTSVPTDKNYAQIVDLYVAYRFNDMFNVRVGSFLSPFSRAEYLVGGAEFADMPNMIAPFDPVRSVGISLFGQPLKDQLAYEININNGQGSNVLGRAAEVSTSGTTSSNAGNNDNRLAYYLRLQYAGAGKLSDFADEPDLRKDTQPLAWLVEGAFGYESANTTSKAFPSPQGSVTAIPVGTITKPGFTTYPLNGDLYRGTLDVAAKYQGLSLIAACFFQQINENPAVNGSTAPTLPGGYGLTGPGANSSFFELGYYGQAGYMLNKNLELVARAGQFITEGSPNRSEEYALGANYYFYGQNLKLQADVTYVPNEAFGTSSTLGTAANTQDVIFRMQLQLKF